MEESTNLTDIARKINRIDNEDHSFVNQAIELEIPTLSSTLNDSLILPQTASSLQEAISNVLDDVTIKNFLSLSSKIAIESCVENLQEEPLGADEILRILRGFECEKSFLLAFKCVKDNSCVFYWKLNTKKQLLSLFCEASVNDEFYTFVRDFLVDALKKGHDGINSECIFDPQNINITLDLHQIGDLRDYNLLFIAAELGKTQVVEFLLNHEFNPVPSIKKVTAADLAYKHKHFDILLALLNVNSRFPRNFNIKESSEELKNFTNLSSELREAIKSEKVERILTILKENSHLRHFYDTKNESIVTFTILAKKFQIYEILLKNNVFFGPRENIDDVMDELSKKEARSLRDLHARHTQKAENHIITLMTNSSIAHENDRKEEKFAYILRTYEILNKNEHIRWILKIVAASQKFKITFDFNREFVRFVDPASESYTNGLFYLNGNVFIGAKYLLDPTREHEVYGTIAHELCHFAICLVYKNSGNPYFLNDKEGKSTYSNIVSDCKKNSKEEEIVEVVFESYPKSSRHQEIVVRAPHMMANYYNNPEKLAECKENFPSLFIDFQERVCVDMENMLPKLQKETKREIEGEAIKKISRLKKIIFALMLLMIFGVPLLVWLIYEAQCDWNELSEEQKNMIYNSTVNYRGIDVRIGDLYPNNSEFYSHLSSKHLCEALDGKLDLLNLDVNSDFFDQFIFFEWGNLTKPFKKKIAKTKVDFQEEFVDFSQLYDAGAFFMDVEMDKDPNRKITDSSSSLDTKSSSIDSNLEFANSDNLKINSLSYLTTNNLKSLISNTSINIGSKIKEESTFYIPRSFIRKQSNETLSPQRAFEVIEDERIFVLTGPPGSGKSFVFKRLSRDFKKFQPKKWVLLIELKNFAKTFDEIQGRDLSIEQIGRLLGKNFQDKTNEFNQTLFQEFFTRDDVVLFWDAIDEISPKYDESMLRICRKIKDQSNNLQFMSTRTQHIDTVEKVFGGNYFILKKFTKEDRKEFLMKFLESKGEKGEKVEKIIKEIEEFIKTIESEEFRLEDQKESVNNPLLLQMIAEIAIQNKLSSNLKNLNNIYGTFVDMKIENVLNKGILRGQDTFTPSFNFNPTEVHQRYALRALFGEVYESYIDKTYVNLTSLNINKKEKKWTNQQIANYGLMTVKSDTEIEFVHRTFAEYFVAQFINDTIYNFDPTDAVNFNEMYKRIALLFHVSYNHYKVVRGFIKGYLKNSRTNAFHQSVLDVIKANYTLFFTEYAQRGNAQTFIDFFERDKKVLHSLLHIDKYSDVNEWLKIEFGINKEENKNYEESNQAGYVLILTWKLENTSVTYLSNFIRNATDIGGKVLKRNPTKIFSPNLGVERLNLSNDSLEGGEKKSSESYRNDANHRLNLGNDSSEGGDGKIPRSDWNELTLTSNDTNPQYYRSNDTNPQYYRSISDVFRSLKTKDSYRILRFDEKFLSDLKAKNSLKSALEFLTLHLTPDEIKQIYINSIYFIQEDLSDEEQAQYFWTNFNRSLNTFEVKEALTKRTRTNQTVLLKSLAFENYNFTVTLLDTIEKHLNDSEIKDLLFQHESNYGATALMMVGGHQIIEIVELFVEFCKRHLSEEEFKEYLLIYDLEDDTVLQYSAAFKYLENFAYIAGIVFLEEFSVEKNREVVLNRSEGLFPFFVEYLDPVYNVENFVTISEYLKYIFEDDMDALKKYLCRRRGGNTAFHQLKSNKRNFEKLKIFARLIDENLGDDQDFFDVCERMKY